METIKLTRSVAKKVLKIVDAGLVNGLGKAEPGKMCVEAAVCFALGLPHNDTPPCVGSAVRRFKICLNDSYWPTNEDRTKGMRKLAIAQLGSNEIDQKEFTKRVVLKTIQKIIPMAVGYALKVNKKLPEEQRKKIEDLSKKCKEVKELSIGREYCLELDVKLRAAYATAADAAYATAAAAYAAAADAADAAYAAAATAAAAAYAADAYADAADADAAYAATAYAADAAYAAAKNKARLEVLNMCAEIGLEALVELKSSGCKWLDLCD